MENYTTEIMACIGGVLALLLLIWLVSPPNEGHKCLFKKTTNTDAVCECGATARYNILCLAPLVPGRLIANSPHWIKTPSPRARGEKAGE